MASDETDDYIAIRRLQNRYADTCSRRAWSELPGLFLSDASVTLDLSDRQLVFEDPEAFVEFVDKQLRQFSFFQFVIRNSVIELGGPDDPDTATGRMWISEFRCHADDEHWSTIFGLYHDHYRRTADGWRFARRLYNSLAHPDEGVILDVADIHFDQSDQS